MTEKEFIELSETINIIFFFSWLFKLFQLSSLLHFSPITQLASAPFIGETQSINRLMFYIGSNPFRCSSVFLNNFLTVLIKKLAGPKN